MNETKIIYVELYIVVQIYENNHMYLHFMSLLHIDMTAT